MQLDAIGHRSSLYLNRHVTRLSEPPLSLNVHYWGVKSEHHGNHEHTHTFFEICYVLDGYGTYTNNGVHYALHQGTLYATKPGSRHRLYSESGMTLLFVAFDLDRRACSDEMLAIYDELCGHPQLFIPNAVDTAAAHLWIALILQSGEPDASPAHAELITRMALAMLHAALLLFSKHHGALHRGDPATGSAPSTILQQAERYVQAHLPEKLSLSKVAKSLFVSGRQLSRLLSEELGQSFPSWVRTERIRRAAYLLAYTDKTAEEIAKETGFDSVHYFSRVFAQMMDTTPGKFRKLASSPTEERTQAVMHRFLSLLVSRHQRQSNR